MAQTEQSRLGNLCEVTAGPSGNYLSNLHDGPDGVPVISPPDLTEQHTVDTRQLRRVPSKDAEKLTRFSLQVGDLLVVRQGSLGRLALIGAEHAASLFSSSCLRVRPQRDRLLPDYLAAYLSYSPAWKNLLGQALPGTVPSLNSEMLRGLRVTVPPMERQHALVDALADIDAQIGVHQAMVARFEELRPAVFTEMVQETERA